MMPVVFTIPILNKDVPGYGLMLTIAFLLSIWWAARRAQRSGADPDVILNCGFVALIAGVVGCRAMYVIHYWDQFRELGGPAQIALGIIDITRGGLEFYGGFILSLIAIPAWLALYEKVSLRWYCDIMAPSAMLGLAIGRIGCLLNGCCYGGTCELPWKMTFPYGSPAAVEQWQRKEPGAGLPAELLYSVPLGITMPLSRESMAASDEAIARAEQQEAQARTALEQHKAAGASADPGKLRTLEEALLAARAPHRDLRDTMRLHGLTSAQVRALADQHRSLAVHPAQIYSTITAGLLAALLSAVYWRRTRDGQVILLMVAIEPITRLLLELIRADNPVDQFGALTISQALAVPMACVGVLGLLALRWLPARSPRAKLWEPEPEPAKAQRATV